MKQGISATGWCLEGNKESTFFCGWRFNHRTRLVKQIFLCFVGLKFPSRIASQRILNGFPECQRCVLLNECRFCGKNRSKILNQKTWTKHTVSTSIAQVGGGITIAWVWGLIAIECRPAAYIYKNMYIYNIHVRIYCTLWKHNRIR